MSDTTTNRGYPFPESDDDFRPYEDIEALAEGVDADMNTQVGRITALESRPACFLTQQTAQTGWTSGTPTAVTFGASSEVLDTDALHDTGSNTSRIVIGKKLGWWKVSGVYCAPNNANTTVLRAVLGKNGGQLDGSYAGGQYSTSSGALQGIPTPVIYVEATNATDYVELFGYQIAASGTIGTGIGGYIRSSLTATWKRPS